MPFDPSGYLNTAGYVAATTTGIVAAGALLIKYGPQVADLIKKGFEMKARLDEVPDEELNENIEQEFINATGRIIKDEPIKSAGGQV